MTNEEIIKEYRQGGDRERALTLLYKTNRPMLYKLAKGYGGDNNIDDLIQEGFIGLMTALERYDLDHDSQASFLHYSMPWIKQAMTRSVKHYEPVRIPEHARQKYFKYKRAEKALEALEGSYSLKAIAEALGWTIEETEDVASYDYLLSQASIDKPVGNEEDSTMGDFIPSKTNIEETATNAMYEDYRNTTLWAQVDKLSREERIAIIEVYKKGQSLEDLARTLQLKYHQAVQRRREGLTSLRRNPEIIRLMRQEGLIEAYERTQASLYDPIWILTQRAELGDLLEIFKEQKAEELREINQRMARGG